MFTQIPCKGKDQSPSPEAVNEVAWIIFSHRAHNPEDHVLVHCTHGFNRTGESSTSTCGLSSH